MTFGVQIFVAVIISITAFLSAFILALCFNLIIRGDKVDSMELFFAIVATIITFALSALLWVEVGRSRVRTKELPVVEKVVTFKECEGEVKSDTTYIFKFRQ